MLYKLNFKIIIKLVSLVLVIVIVILSVYNNTQDIYGIVYGNQDSKVEIVNYTSFQCSECVTFHEKFGETIEKYINSGEIQYIEKQIDIQRFKYDDVIYKHMNKEQISDFSKLSEIYKKRNEWIILKSAKEVIEFLDLEKEENPKYIKDIEKINKEKVELELKGVPTMFINGEKVSTNISKEEFENKIEELLNQK